MMTMTREECVIVLVLGAIIFAFIVGYGVYGLLTSEIKEYIGIVTKKEVERHRRSYDDYYCSVRDKYGNNHRIDCDANAFCELERGLIYEFKVVYSPVFGEHLMSVKKK